MPSKKELKEYCSEHGLARRHVVKILEIPEATVKHWFDGTRNMPAEKFERLRSLVSSIESQHHEWICGEGVETAVENRIEYLIHTRHPRFICIVGQSGTRDEISGLTYTTKYNDLLCHFQWLDPTPAGQDLEWLLESAGEVVNEYTYSDEFID